jgi:glycosyltransferase involved in cell wall biosynthesis
MPNPTSIIEISDKETLPAYPRVSVIILAYNHGEYLAKAIESILAQKVDFDFEIIIGEDYSSDNTLEVAFSYKNKYPDLIKVIHSASNVGMNLNLLRLLVSARGTFVAICEGDDYWLNPEKLSLQIIAFEMREELMLIFTDREVLINNDLVVSRYAHRDYGLKDVMEGFIPPTQTMMWRNDPELHTLISLHLSNRSGDRLIAFFCAKKGVIGHLDVVTAVYRMSGFGVWSSTAISSRRRLKYQHLQDFHKMLKIIDEKSLINCAGKLFLDTLFDIKNSNGERGDNIRDVFYFYKILGVLTAISLVINKLLNTK